VFLRLHELSQGGEPELMAKAVAAGEVLLRLQDTTPDKDLPFSVVQRNATTGAATTYRPSNFGGTSCAVLLFSKLYNIARNESWLTAAQEAADVTISKWLQPAARPIEVAQD
jgi:hypothetical protein